MIWGVAGPPRGYLSGRFTQLPEGKKHGAKRLLPGCCLITAKNPQNHLAKCPVIFTFWQLSEATASVPAWRVCDPPMHRQGASKSKQKNLFKNQNFMKKRGEKRLLSGCCLISVRNPPNPLVKCPVIFALWQLSEATA